MWGRESWEGKVVLSTDAMLVGPQVRCAQALAHKVTAAHEETAQCLSTALSAACADFRPDCFSRVWPAPAHDHRSLGTLHASAANAALKHNLGHRLSTVQALSCYIYGCLKTTPIHAHAHACTTDIIPLGLYTSAVHEGSHDINIHSQCAALPVAVAPLPAAVQRA